MKILAFSPYSYETKGQFCWPGYDLPVGCFMRSPNGTFPEYLIKTIDVLERNETYSRVDAEKS